MMSRIESTSVPSKSNRMAGKCTPEGSTPPAMSGWPSARGAGGVSRWRRAQGGRISRAAPGDEEPRDEDQACESLRLRLSRRGDGVVEQVVECVQQQAGVAAPARVEEHAVDSGRELV